MKLTDAQNSLIDILKAKGLDKDNVVATMLELKSEDNFKNVLQWLEKNKEAGQDEIFEHIDKMLY